MSENMSDHFDKINAVLDKFGGFWTVEDILDAIEVGKMQSFANDGTWVVTQVQDFPRKRVLDIVLVYGNMRELQALEQTVYDYGVSVGAEMIKASGRLGWIKRKFGGWRLLNANYIRELS